MAGVVLGHMAGVARMGSGWLRRRAWFSGVAVGAAAFFVAGVALGDMLRGTLRGTREH